MKNLIIPIILYIFCLFSSCDKEKTVENYINITDTNFEKALITDGIDDVLDGKVSKSSVSKTTILSINSKKISNLSGLENFTQLKYLNCSDNLLTNLDVSKLFYLEVLFCHSNQLTNLDVSKSLNLRHFYCHSNQLSNLDVSKNNLIYLYCHNNKIQTICVKSDNLYTKEWQKDSFATYKVCN
ncbi:hypothetical protein [Emticicia aquatica]|nr:hypothetical protein [Emticicia aquatica]